MITNHSYLDNPTFRGMRQSLMKTFDEIYILDLHGNSLKRETTPDGGTDENVFDIRQGVAISLFLKMGMKTKQKIYQDDLFGLRENKYQWLNINDSSKCNYPEVQPASPYYFFIQRNVDNIAKYLDWMKINEVFPVNSVGIVTARDKLTIKWNKEEIWNTVLNFSEYDPEFAREVFQLGKDSREWKITLAQEDIKESGLNKDNIQPILYRPFDIRYTYYTGNSRGFHCRPRNEVMGHMIKGANLGLITVRRCPSHEQPGYFFISEFIISNGVIRSDNVSIDTFFPLYLYPSYEQPDIFNQSRTCNISSKVIEKLNNNFRINTKPNEIFAYIYSIFYSNIYRKKYAQFLQIDFPRIPFVTDYQLFQEMESFGSKLIDLHLLQSPLLEKSSVKFQGNGEDVVIGKRKYDKSTRRIYINNNYYFEGVLPEVWEYQIGGYQVMDKYIKDRKGRRMDDPRHYIHIATAIEKTIGIQKEIDAIYPEVEKDLIEF